MNTTLKITTLTVSGVFLLGSFFIVKSVRTDQYLNTLVEGGPTGMLSSGGGMSKEETSKYEARSRAFNDVWMARHERDITQELLPYLQDPKGKLRERAACALAHLEAEEAEEALDQLKQKTEESQKRAKGDFYKYGGAFPLTVDMALSRIRSRHLKGVGRLNAVAGGAGLSWGEVLRLSQKIQERQYPANDPKNPADEILRQMVDVLYVMGKKGENIQPFVQQMALSPAYKIKLKGASLSQDDEIELVMEYLSGPFIAKQDDYDLAKKHFAGLGPRAAELLEQRLADPNFSPKTPNLIFETVLAIHDQRFLPLLPRYAKHPNPEIRHRASQVWARLEPESRYPWYAPQMP